MRRRALQRIAAYLDTITDVGYIDPDIDLDAGKIRLVKGLIGDILADGSTLHITFGKLSPSTAYSNGSVTGEKRTFKRTASGWLDALE